MSNRLEATRSFLNGSVTLALRLWLGINMSIAHGWPKLGKVETFTKGVEDLQLPGPAWAFAWGAILAELVGGVMVAAGVLTRAASAALFATMIVAGFIAHAGDPWVKKEFALTYAMISLFFLVVGPGRFSIDHLLDRRRAARVTAGGNAQATKPEAAAKDIAKPATKAPQAAAPAKTAPAAVAPSADPRPAAAPPASARSAVPVTPTLADDFGSADDADTDALLRELEARASAREGGTKKR